MKLFEIEFTREQWDEIEELGFAGFQPEEGVPLSAGQWRALSWLADGKASRILAGDFNLVSGTPLHQDDILWSERITDIARKIRQYLQPVPNKFETG